MEFHLQMFFYVIINCRLAAKQVPVAKRGDETTHLEKGRRAISRTRNTLAEVTVLDVWCDKMPCVTAPERRKLLALALASLLTSESPVVLSRVYMVLLNIAETLNDVTRTDEQGGVIDSLMAGQGDVVLDTDDIDYETEHDSRKRQIAMQDPVHT